MTITIELEEIDAACVWADSTWSGKYPRPLKDILTDEIRTAAVKYRQAFKLIEADLIGQFRAAQETA